MIEKPKTPIPKNTIAQPDQQHQTQPIVDRERNSNANRQMLPYNDQLRFQHRVVARGPKLSFPEFHGDDYDGWIRKAEKYFELLGIPPEDRVKIAVLYVSGRLNIGGEALGVMLTHYPGTISAEWWGIGSIKCLNMRLLVNFII